MLEIKRINSILKQHEKSIIFCLKSCFLCSIVGQLIDACPDIIIYLKMCEHHTKSKYFCLNQDCSSQQIYGCNSCIKSNHKHSQSISEQELVQLLKKYGLPSGMKQGRKQLVLKLYTFLNMLKNQFYDHIDVYLNNILSQIKYSYLYHEDILEVYRLIRDQKYHKIKHKEFALFHQKSKKYSKEQINNKQQNIYNQYLKTLNLNIQKLSAKITDVQKLFQFKISKNCSSLKQKFISSLEGLSNGNSNKKPKEYSGLSPKKNKIIQDMDMPYYVDKSTLFLTPVKNSVEMFDSSTQKIKSSLIIQEDKSRKNSIDIASISYSQNSPIKKTSPERKENAQSIKATKDNVNNSLLDNKIDTFYRTIDFKHNKNEEYSYEAMHKEQSLIKLEKYEEKLIFVPTKGSSLQIFKNNQINGNHQSKPKPIKQDDSPKLVKQMNEIIKQRQQTAKSKLNSLLNQHNRIDETIRKISQHNKALQKEERRKTIESQDYSIDKKKVEQNKYKKKPEEKIDRLLVQKEHTITDKLKQSSKVQSRYMDRKNNDRLKTNQGDSIGKQIFQYSGQAKPQLLTKSILKQIPHQSTKTDHKEEEQQHEKVKKKPWEMIRDEQIQQGAIFISGINQSSNENKIFFLEKYLKTYKNNLTAIQCLSFLYLQSNNFKACLNHINHCLDRINLRFLQSKYKCNLMINKTAALNNLGRYSETIQVLQSFKFYQNDKIHKNLADAFFSIGTYDKSIYHYQKSIQLNSKLDQAFYNLAVILFIQDNFQYAKINIDKALMLNPTHPVYRELLLYIQEKIMNNIAHQQ